ncbi:MAG: adenosylmethionine decarboxylase [Flavobacteriales bacterium]|nr:adenosylmethionine decarboxylase [Flavobacteriales bacterium]
MEGLGLHILMEFHGCSFEKLNDLPSLEEMMNDAARASNATIIKSVFHQFSPQGVTGVIVVAESHLAIHTWPENGYAAVDFFTCNVEMDYVKTYDLIALNLASANHSYQCVKRGLLPNNVIGKHELSTY